MRVRSSFSLRNQSARTCDESDGSAPDQGNAEDKRCFFFDFALFSYVPRIGTPAPIPRINSSVIGFQPSPDTLSHDRYPHGGSYSQIAVIGEENQPLGIFIQAANGNTRLLWLTKSTMLSRSPSSWY